MKRLIPAEAASLHVISITIVVITVLLCRSTMAVRARVELVKGFMVTPDLSVSSFQAILDDPTGNFSLGFHRVNESQLAVVILHVPSSEQIWTANPTAFAGWSDRTQLFFNGSLVVSDTDGKVYWSAGTGDRVVLLNSSNLQIQLAGNPPVIRWQSFDCPSDTLVENQNFTSNMTLISSNKLYSMRLGKDFIGLYAEFNRGKNQIYYKRRALQARAQVIPGGGPLRLRLNFDGFLGVYQNGSLPVDLQAFNTFQKSANGFLRIRLEPDGNFKGFYWEGSKWVLDYEAISEQCELPNPCGSYGLCEPGSGCSCIDNNTVYNSGECLRQDSGDFCDGGIVKNNFWVLRRSGVELPFKELMDYKSGLNLEQCESFCEGNCTCWGSLYNNVTGFCHLLDYPIQTVVATADQAKMGFFKVRKVSAKTKMKLGVEVGLGIMGGIIGFVVAIFGFVIFWEWRRRRGISRLIEEDDGSVSPGPYKNLGSASFKSIEMSSGSGFSR